MPMFVRKADVRAHGRTPGCGGCQDVIRELTRCRPHTRMCRERMEKMLADTEDGRKRVKDAEDRMIQATFRRSDAYFAEAEEKKRRVDGEPPVAEEATLTGGASGSAGATAAPETPAPSRKRGPEVDIRDIDPAAGDAADNAITVGGASRKRQADSTVADIDPSAGAGTDVSVVDASPQRGSTPGGVLGNHEANRTIASMDGGDPVSGLTMVAGGATSKVKPQRHGPAQRIFGNIIPQDELQWREIGSGMWARSFVGMTRLITTTRSGPQEAEVKRRIIRNVDTGKIIVTRSAEPASRFVRSFGQFV